MSVLFPLGRTSRSFDRAGVARRHLGQNRLVASNSPKLSCRVIAWNSTQGLKQPNADSAPSSAAAAKLSATVKEAVADGEVEISSRNFERRHRQSESSRS